MKPLSLLQIIASALALLVSIIAVIFTILDMPVVANICGIIVLLLLGLYALFTIIDSRKS